MEARLDRFEAMMEELISSVGQIMENQTEMRLEMEEMKKNIKQLQTDVTQLHKNQERLETKSDKRYNEILEHLSLFRRDQAVIWEKLAIHERQIAKLESVTK